MHTPPMEDIRAFFAEYDRSLTLHPPEEWETLTPSQMRRAVEQELNEFTNASAINDYTGPHGMIAESLHCSMTAFRAYQELKRRYGG